MRSLVGWRTSTGIFEGRQPKPMQAALDGALRNRLHGRIEVSGVRFCRGVFIPLLLMGRPSSGACVPPNSPLTVTGGRIGRSQVRWLVVAHA